MKVDIHQTYDPYLKLGDPVPRDFDEYGHPYGSSQYAAYTWKEVTEDIGIYLH